MAFTRTTMRLTVPLLAVGLIILCVWARRLKPPDSFIDNSRGRPGVIMVLPTAVVPPGALATTTGDGQPTPTAAWRIHIRFDDGMRPPGQDWIVHEGRQPGEGYELHWSAGRLLLQLYRTPTDRLMLLGSVVLANMPHELIFTRRGARLVLIADGREVVHCLDPSDTPPAVAWGFQTASTSPELTLTLHRDDQGDAAVADPLRSGSARSSAPIPASAGGRSPMSGAGSDALLSLRRAFAFDPGQQAQAMAAALAEAGDLIARLGSNHPDHDRLQHWQALGEAQLALAQGDQDEAERSSRTIDQLILLAERSPSPESVGMLLSLLPRIAQRTWDRRLVPTPLAEVQRSRRAWLRILGAAAAAIDARRGTLRDEQSLQIRLLVHGSSCLRGEAALPTPADAPDWLATRWRAFSGGNPEVRDFPPIPRTARDPVLPAVERLVQGAGFEPVAATTMRAAMMDALRRPSGADWRGALEAIERSGLPRESVIARALVALHALAAVERIASPQDRAIAEADADRLFQGARQSLDAGHDRQEAWIDRDVLALACYHLLGARGGALAVADPEADPTAGRRTEIPAKLRGPFERLLSGGRTVRGRGDEAERWYAVQPPPMETINDIWLGNAPAPPAQVLATILAMQEVLGGRPDWSLLDQVPSFTLPLHLMARRGAQSSGSNPAPAPIP